MLGWSTVNDVFVQRLNALGNRVWGDSGVQVTNRPGNVSAGNVAITSNGYGGAIVAWVEGDYPEDMMTYTQCIDSAGNILWTQNGITLSDTSMSSGGVAISRDITGRAIVNWSSHKKNGVVDTARMFAQRVSPSGQLQWGMNGIRLGQVLAGGSKRNTSDLLGGAYIGYGNKIQHVDSNGNLLWSAERVEFTSYQTLIQNSSQTINSFSGIWNFWSQETDQQTSFDIYGQYINSLGNILWESIGRPICIETNIQNTPQAISDNHGSAIIVWDDFRNGHSNVYAAKVDTVGTITKIEDQGQLLPLVPYLEQNYPNPFNPSTTIEFFLTTRSYVTLKIFNLLGEEIEVLVNGELEAGEHLINWEAKNLPSGIYFYKLTTDNLNITKKMILLR